MTNKLPIKYKTICDHCGIINFTATIPTICDKCGTIFNHHTNEGIINVALKEILYKVQLIRLSEVKDNE